MAGQPFDMNSAQAVRVTIGRFKDVDGVTRTVDKIDWMSSDPTVFTPDPSADGMTCRAVSVDMTEDQPAHGANLEMHVTEAGVPDAIVETWAGTVKSALTSPPATGFDATVGAPEPR